MQVSFSQGRAELNEPLMVVVGVVGVAGVPVDRPLRLPHPNREVVVEEGDVNSSTGKGKGTVLRLSKQ